MLKVVLKKSLRMFMLLISPLAIILLVTPATAEPVEPSFIYNFVGEFELIQEDNPGCRYSTAPLTGGSVLLTIDTTQDWGFVTMDGQGNGRRNDLPCGEFTGDIVWSVEYEIEASGPFKIEDQVIQLEGNVVGAGMWHWEDCVDQVGNPTSCPNGSPSTSFEYPVIFEGAVSCQEGGMGGVQLTDISLGTYGTWNVEPDVLLDPGRSGFIIYEGNKAWLNGEPLVPGCFQEVATGDVMKIDGSAQIVYRCQQVEQQHFYMAYFGPGNEFTIEQIAKERLENVFCNSYLETQRRVDDIPLIELAMGDGSMSFLTAPGVPSVSIGSSAAVSYVGGNAHAIVRNQLAEPRSEVLTLKGQATIVPINPALQSVMLEPGQQVAISETVVSPVIDLSMAKFPLISGN